jgi:ferritin-like metal-binding protein YciE
MPGVKKGVVMETLINKSKSTLEHTKLGPVRDAAIIAVVQKIRHYTIAGYRTFVNYGKTFGDKTIVAILNKTLVEQQEIDVFLSEAAYNTINFDAAIDENKFIVSHYEIKNF